MISFYPGPSRVYDEIPHYVQDAHRDGIMSMNHRSPEFESLMQKTIGELKKKLEIPAAYTILFASSATECWEIIAQSLVKQKSTHIFNGAFGQKWFHYTQRLVAGAQPYSFHRDEELKPEKLIFRESDVICLTQNETSNGTQVSNGVISEVKKRNPDALIAVDATSSMAGIFLNFRAADVWFASVQKCFGLPAGLAVLVCSPRAIRRTSQLAEKDHYNSLLFMKEMADRWQTSYTPNVLGIYLLMRVLQKSKPIRAVHARSVALANEWNHYFSSDKRLRLFIQTPKVRSHTVICITAEEALISMIKQKARVSGFLLGEGYGALKNETFRIANFPALKKTEIQKLRSFLKNTVPVKL
jgi:phosphoserine aminotransferase